jgi:hypothetical protein
MTQDEESSSRISSRLREVDGSWYGAITRPYRTAKGVCALFTTRARLLDMPHAWGVRWGQIGDIQVVIREMNMIGKCHDTPPVFSNTSRRHCSNTRPASGPRQ